MSCAPSDGGKISSRSLILLGLVALLYAGAVCWSVQKPGNASTNQATEGVSYFRQIRPIIQRQCQGCHQPALKQGDLLLITYEGFKAGGKKGPAFRAGDPEHSVVVLHLKGELKPQMPLGGDPLPKGQIDLFRRWIAEGAKDDTPEESREDALTSAPATYHAPPVITALAFSPDGQKLAVSGYREVLLLKPDGSELTARLASHSDRIHSITFSPDGKIMATVGGTPARFGEVELWDVAERKLKRSVKVSYDTLFGATFSPDGRELAFGGADKIARVLDVETGQELVKLEHHDDWVFGAVFSLDGKRLVTVGRDRAAKLSEISTGAFIENLNLLKGALDVVARHPTRDVVLVGGEEGIPYLYAMRRSGQMKVADDSPLIRAFERQPGKVITAVFSPDGQKIAVGGDASEIRMYSTDSGEKLASLTGLEGGIYALAFSPTGQQLAAGGFDGWVWIYDVSSAKALHSFLPVPVEKPLLVKK